MTPRTPDDERSGPGAGRVSVAPRHGTPTDDNVVVLDAPRVGRIPGFGRGGRGGGGGGRRSRKRPGLPPERIGRRALTIVLVYAIAFLGVVIKLGDIQVVNAQYYADRGAQQRERVIDLQARRGRLYDRDGAVLATTVDSASIFANPEAFRSRTLPDGSVAPGTDPALTASLLAPLLEMDAADIEERLGRDGKFVYLRRRLDWTVGEQITDLAEAEGIEGIGLQVEPLRDYPAGSLAAQVLGFVDIDGLGRGGLESEFDELLRGRPGQLAVELAPGGVDIASGLREVVAPEPGRDLVLTIDREIQDAAERAAAGAIARYGAKSASVVVLDVETGEILAMATGPSFDANDPGASPAANWRNRSVTDVFEPGSVQKAITAAAAIEEGIVTSDTISEVDDTIMVGRSKFTDSHTHEVERMTFAQIIETSSNVGTIQVAQELGEDRLAAWLTAFGYGRKPGLGFPQESAGIVLPLDSWWESSLPTISIGHGVAVSLLQIATAYATIANDGVMLEPTLLRGTVGTDGRLAPTGPGTDRTVLSADTAVEVREILTRVVHGPQGTGKLAAVPGYTVAGKTGTARKPREDGKGYTNTYAASFVGMAPADDPKLVVAVTIDEPYPIYGGVTAAPVFAEVMGFALPHRRIPPTHPGAPLKLDPIVVEQAIELAEQEGLSRVPVRP